MNINKAIRKQKRSIKRFVLSMGFIFILLPSIAYFYKVFSLFLLIYLSLIEILIIVVIIRKIDKASLSFECSNKFKIHNGIFGERYNIDCKKVEIIHTINEGENLEITIILKSRLRNKRVKRIDPKFVRSNKWASKYYNNLKLQSPGGEYYYILLDKGGYIKYKLLDELYKFCTNAHFTENSIKSIKEYRN